MLTVSRKLALTVFLVVALHAAPAGPQNYRYFAAVASVVEDGHFAIAQRFSDYHPDFISIGNARYPNMPPGMTLLLAPTYWLYVHTVGTIISESSPLYVAMFGIWAVLTVNAPILAVASVLMFRLVRRFTDDDAKSAWLTLALMFGTPVFSYSTQLWSHDCSMALVIGVFYLTIFGRPAWAVGALMGALALMENHAPLSLSMLGAFWLWNARERLRETAPILREVAVLAMVFLPFVFGQLYYNYAITGSMWGNTQVIWFQQHTPGESIFVWPSLERVWGVTFSPFRGVFLYAPLSMLAVAGLLRDRALPRSVHWFCWIFALGYFLLSVTFLQWSTGVSFGPRYFASALPFLVMTTVVWPTPTIRNWTLASIFINWAGATTNPTFNLFTNLALFTSRGPLLSWLEQLNREVLPRCCHSTLAVVTPFWIFVAAAGMLWWIWKPRQAAGAA